jgi:hypothetical protein
MPCVIVHPNGDDRPATRQNDARICTPYGVPSHPAHRAVKPTAQPFLEPRQQPIVRTFEADCRNADGGKAEGPGFVFN